MAAGTTTAARKKRGQARIDVLFAYTPSAKAAAGSKAALKAAVGQAAAVTNLAFDNSGIKAKIRVKGIVKVKGTRATTSSRTSGGSSVRATAVRQCVASAGQAPRRHRPPVQRRPGRQDLWGGCPAVHRALRGSHPGGVHVVPLLPALHRRDARARSQPGRRPHRLPRRHPLLEDPGFLRLVRRAAPLHHGDGLLRARVRTSATSPACGSPSSPTRRGTTSGSPSGTRRPTTRR